MEEEETKRNTVEDGGGKWGRKRAKKEKDCGEKPDRTLWMGKTNGIFKIFAFQFRHRGCSVVCFLMSVLEAGADGMLVLEDGIPLNFQLNIMSVSVFSCMLQFRRSLF